jgi:lipopolysaccharide heptosyltransferase II
MSATATDQTPVPPAFSLLIVLMGSLGDIARGLCLVAHLKTHRPGCRLTWLVEPKWAPLVQCHPLIDRVIIFQRAWRVSALQRLRQDLSGEVFDIALDLQRHFKSGFFSWLSGAARRIGFHRRNAKEGNWLFNNEHIAACSNELPKILHYLKFAEQLGLPAPDRLDFGLQGIDLATQAATHRARIGADGFIVLVMGSSWPSKNWWAEGYLQLTRLLLEQKRLRVVLVGDRSQTAVAARLTAAVPDPRLIDLTGRTSLLELTALLKAARAAVGPDSGPGHLAAAVGTPYVSLFGPTDPRRVAPWRCERWVVRAGLACAPCNKRRCPDPSHPCMRRIPIDAVLEKLDDALSSERISHQSARSTPK